MASDRPQPSAGPDQADVRRLDEWLADYADPRRLMDLVWARIQDELGVSGAALSVRLSDREHYEINCALRGRLAFSGLWGEFREAALEAAIIQGGFLTISAMRNKGALGRLFAETDTKYVVPLLANNVLYGWILLGDDATPLFRSGVRRRALLGVLGRLGHVARNAGLDNRLAQAHSEKLALLEVGRTISSSLDLDRVLTLVVEAMKQVVDYDAAGIFLLDDKTRKVRKRFYLGYEPEHIDRVHLKVGQGIVGWVIKRGEGEIVPDVTREDRYFEVRSASRSEICAPIAIENCVIGAFNLESDRRNAYTQHDLELLAAFADMTAMAIRNAKLHQEAVAKREIDRELAIAADIQRAMLPRQLPEVRGIKCSAVNMSSGSVGGDTYDAIALRDGAFAFAIGDVFGKGIPGALLMASLTASFRAKIRSERSLAQVADILNRILGDENQWQRYATFFFGVFDPNTLHGVYVNAGHCPPLLVRASGEVEELDVGGIPFGFIPDAEFVEGALHLRPGDRIILYTDGIIEAEDAQEEQFEVARLIETVLSVDSLDPKRTQQAVIDAVRRFAGGTNLEDDVTILTVVCIDNR